MEIVIALLMYLNDPPVLKEHLLMPTLSECLKKKRIATRNSNADYKCMKVKAVVKDGKKRVDGIKRAMKESAAYPDKFGETVAVLQHEVFRKQ